MASIFLIKLLINRLKLPVELLEIIKGYVFREIKEIDYYDLRYDMIWAIPRKSYDKRHGSASVFLPIREDCDLMVAFFNNTYYVQKCERNEDREDYDERFHYFHHYTARKVPLR
jgi:hypothetical protein